jgi:hypothetical protein
MITAKDSPEMEVYDNIMIKQNQLYETLTSNFYKRHICIMHKRKMKLRVVYFFLLLN